MGNVIKINDGLKTYDIVNQDDKLLGQFSFNPSDTNIVHRHAEVVDALEKIEIPDRQESDIESTLKSIESVIFERINYLLGADVSNTFFSIMGPLTPLANGQFFIETVLDAIGQAIQSETGERVKKINNKISKHTSKYHR